MSPLPRPIALLGAPSSIGIRPYDNGAIRHLDRAPAVLRALGLADRLNADDLGDVTPPPYQDFVRPAGRARNEAGVVAYSRALAERVGTALAGGRFTLLLGGDCSIVLGALLGARRAAGTAVGLAYVDGHADFATPSESITGSVASMCLAQAVGRGETPLARLAPDGPLVAPRNVVVIGRHDEAVPWLGHGALQATEILDVPASDVRSRGARAAAVAALERLEQRALGGFWIHLDADVLASDVMPAVDSPDPNGLDIPTLTELLRPLVHHPGALGLALTIYDPGLDPDRACAVRLAALLEDVLAGGSS